jgi:hypothetical protein
VGEGSGLSSPRMTDLSTHWLTSHAGIRQDLLEKHAPKLTDRRRYQLHLTSQKRIPIERKMGTTDIAEIVLFLAYGLALRNAKLLPANHRVSALDDISCVLPRFTL